MTSISSIAASGLSAAQRHLDSSARNIASLSNPSVSRQPAIQNEGAGGGVSPLRTQSGEPGPELAKDLIYQLQSKNEFLASLEILKTDKATMGSLLDISA